MMQVGDKLPNGATVLEYKSFNGPFGYDDVRNVVLAKTDGYMPYVTWRLDAIGNAYWGHYYSNLNEAKKDFQERE